MMQQVYFGGTDAPYLPAPAGKAAYKPPRLRIRWPRASGFGRSARYVCTVRGARAGRGKGLMVGRTQAFASAPILTLHLTGVPTTAKVHAQCIFICTQLHFAVFNKYFTAEQCIWVTNEGARGPEVPWHVWLYEMLKISGHRISWISGPRKSSVLDPEIIDFLAISASPLEIYGLEIKNQQSGNGDRFVRCNAVTVAVTHPLGNSPDSPLSHPAIVTKGKPLCEGRRDHDGSPTATRTSDELD
ncbi:hypothetical protein B0H11DRAFT_1936651 [Mycena galericulata]|nr:hypothetical protein B0H11DRAFT_1936651 [Mycena galericulata]